MTPERLAAIRQVYDGLSPDAYVIGHPGRHAVELLAHVDELQAEIDVSNAVNLVPTDPGAIERAIADLPPELRTPTVSAKTPRDGVCMKCRRWLPLFEFECIHAEFWEVDSRTLWLCTRDWSKAKLIDERGDSCACKELPIRVPRDFDPWTPPPRTALERAFAVGPIAGPIRAYDPAKKG